MISWLAHDNTDLSNYYRPLALQIGIFILAEDFVFLKDAKLVDDTCYQQVQLG